MKIREILRNKGRTVVTITGDRTVLEAVAVLVEHNIGSVVVVEGDRPRGILTERDILRLTARSPGELDSIPVATAMTSEVITTTPDRDLTEVMDVMTGNKVRHLPVVEEGRLTGIVSIGDVVNACRVSAEEENSHLRRYINVTG